GCIDLMPFRVAVMAPSQVPSKKWAAWYFPFFKVLSNLVGFHPCMSTILEPPRTGCRILTYSGIRRASPWVGSCSEVLKRLLPFFTSGGTRKRTVSVRFVLLFFCFAGRTSRAWCCGTRRTDEPHCLSLTRLRSFRESRTNG